MMFILAKFMAVQTQTELLRKLLGTEYIIRVATSNSNLICQIEVLLWRSMGKDSSLTTILVILNTRHLLICLHMHLK